MHAITPAVFFSFLLLASASPFQPRGIATAETAAVCDAKDFCSGVDNHGSPSDRYVCGDNRLGPLGLENHEMRKNDILGNILDNYQPFADSCPGDFLGKYGQGKGFRYPEKNGFKLDSHGEAIEQNITLAPRTIIDRFGPDKGSFVSPYGTPYEQRSLPPGNLATNPKYSDGTPYNFHVYEVIKHLPVLAGPIAPWFGQPGNGTQYLLSMRVQEAIRDGFLVETCNPGMQACGTDANTKAPTRITCNKNRRWETAAECGQNQLCKLNPTNQMPSCQPKSSVANPT